MQNEQTENLLAALRTIRRLSAVAKLAGLQQPDVDRVLEIYDVKGLVLGIEMYERGNV